MLEIDYEKIDINELERIYFIHCGIFSFICDADRKKIYLEKENEIN